jgi:hypothetical protein
MDFCRFFSVQYIQPTAVSRLLFAEKTVSKIVDKVQSSSEWLRHLARAICGTSKIQRFRLQTKQDQCLVTFYPSFTQ